MNQSKTARKPMETKQVFGMNAVCHPVVIGALVSIWFLWWNNWF